MSTATLRKVGGSVVLAIPRRLLELVQLDTGSSVEINVANGNLVIEPKKRPRYDLETLLAQCNQDNMALSDEDKDWLNAPDVGMEQN